MTDKYIRPIGKHPKKDNTVFSFKKLVESTNARSLMDLLNSLASDGRWAKAIEGQTKAWLKANGYEHWTTVDDWFTEKEGK